MKVYVIAGKAGSGKNTSANYIKEYYEEKGKKVVITEISKYLKLFAYELLNWDGKRETKPRKFLQDVGSYIRYEAFDEDFLINRLVEDVKIYEKYVDVVIVADARLPREIDDLKNEYNATAIKIINKFNDYELKNEEKVHETEVALNSYDKFDYVIENETFNKLKEDIYKLVEEVEK
ncbi:MAG: hypothetical protein K6G37_01400 [Bacilli bacterium]|nr:hypothetical protein [Bacilli bacterium]